MSDFPNQNVDSVDMGPLLWWAVELLGAALVLDVFLAVSWTAPFTEPTTWVLIGGCVGGGLRLAGRSLGANGNGPCDALRWGSLLVWAASAGGGLLAWIL